MQWAALLLLTSSVASIQIAKSQTRQLEIPFLPVVLTICSSGLAGLAGVVIEKLMKGKSKVSIFQQNLWLNLYPFFVCFSHAQLERLSEFCVLGGGERRFVPSADVAEPVQRVCVAHCSEVGI